MPETNAPFNLRFISQVSLKEIIIREWNKQRNGLFQFICRWMIFERKFLNTRKERFSFFTYGLHILSLSSGPLRPKLYRESENFQLKFSLLRYDLGHIRKNTVRIRHLLINPYRWMKWIVVVYFHINFFIRLVPQW